MFKINIIGIDDFVRTANAEIMGVKERIAIEYARIGEEYVNEAKQAADYGGLLRYNNDTNNLRNGNSYRVYIDGKPYKESIGRPETNAMFNTMKVNTGIQLVVGTGMNYASFVEGKYERNVTASGFALVERLMHEFKSKKI